MRRIVNLLAGLGVVLGSYSNAGASFHLIKIVEVYAGSAASPNAQYVVLQTYAVGETFVSGHSIQVFDATGAATPGGTFTFGSNLANGANQVKILIATAEAAAFFGLSADLTMTPVLARAGGKVCYDTIDCVAWGTYSGPSAGIGTPVNVPGGGLPLGRAVIRRLDVAGSATVLEGADDTNNNANDFVVGTPSPRNNAGSSGTVPSSTCGNGTPEGLEACDDANTTSGDGCSATCRLEIPKEASPSGDMTLAKGVGGAVIATYSPACGAMDHAAYAGSGPIAGGVSWTNSFCGLGTISPVVLPFADPPANSFLYFVIVAQTALAEGSYGRARPSGVERPEASGVGACDLPQVLSGACP